jgi:hypothetical protein
VSSGVRPEEERVVSVYLRTGQKIDVRAAETVKLSAQIAGGVWGKGSILACHDAAGKTVAEFFAETVSGYVVGPRHPPARTDELSGPRARRRRERPAGEPGV